MTTILKNLRHLYVRTLEPLYSWTPSSCHTGLQGKPARDQGCCTCRKQSGQKASPDGRFTEDDMERVMDRLGMKRSGEEVKRSAPLKCPDCIALDLVSLLEEKEASLEELRGAFSVFDENGDGFISEAELQRVMHKLELSEGRELEDCRRMIGAFDEDGDGRIDFQEFKKMLENTA